ncbi:SDR family oxidoreductase [Nocardia sp. NEAU-351]|uniref:SDR family oxidoreductase n=1 Tax=Nocardia bovistercoris TaxID=2785916 RepID=A0A931I683_9NOCA|nr:SDR family oxidoreductase [Nocardia bovistercoris]
MVLVTGAARGIGAETARVLAAEGDHVVVNYREKRKRAQGVVDAIRAAGGSASVAGADIAAPEAARTLIDGVVAEFGRLDVLVLNASGGLERGADPGYAMAINRDAQRRLVEAAAPHMRSGARIVFVTSHQAHFHGRKPVPEDYAPIAASKRAGEDALRAMIPELEARGIELRVVSGDMIEGTIIVTLLERRNPDAVSARKSHGELPTVAEFAGAVAAATRATGVSGGTVYVGGADYLVEVGAVGVGADKGDDLVVRIGSGLSAASLEREFGG